MTATLSLPPAHALDGLGRPSTPPVTAHDAAKALPISCDRDAWAAFIADLKAQHKRAKPVMKSVQGIRDRKRRRAIERDNAIRLDAWTDRGEALRRLSVAPAIVRAWAQHRNGWKSGHGPAYVVMLQDERGPSALAFIGQDGSEVVIRSYDDSNTGAGVQCRHLRAALLLLVGLSKPVEGAKP